MLTICIPVFNYDVRLLTNKLLQQMQAESEIIIIDDCSLDSFKGQYKEIQNEKTTVILLNENIGRARIRNLFLQYARFENLLFLDCDSQIIKTDFLKNYFNCIPKAYNVICGGRIYPQEMGNKKYALHWKYGIVRESKSATIRNLQSSRSFMTNNFMIRKEIFLKTHFNDKLYGYGHEDTLLGFELMKSNIRIEHINNPVLHGHLETNKEFLEKTKSGIRNLLIILNEVNEDPEFINDVSLLKVFFKFKRYGIDKILFFFAPVFIFFISGLLKSGFINLRLFDLYKLLVFVRLYEKHQKQFFIVYKIHTND
jgi:glycosyltransferase involved in cell wall biosynthesis